MRILVVLATLTCAAAANAQTLSGIETQVTNAAADQFDPAIASNLVVYTDFSGVDADVWYTDLTTGLSHAVTTAPGDQQLTGVSDGRVVFTDWNTMDVLVFDVASGVTTNLTNAAGSNSLDPAVSGGLVAWTDDRDGNAEIYARDLQTGIERRITNDPLVDQSPAVGGSLIVWERCDGYACDVFVYDWATNATRQLTATPYASERFPDVSGRTVVFQREQGTPIDKDLVAVNLDAEGEKVLALAGDQENPHVSGDYVAFNDSSSGVPHIGLWNLSTNWRFQLTNNASGQYLNDIDGNRVVYSDNRAGTLDIWMYTFTVEAPNPSLPTSCDDLGGAVPVLDEVYTRTKGKPNVFVDAFAAAPGPGLVCIDNPADGASMVHSGWVFLNRQMVVGPWGWQPGLIESDATLKADNTLRVTLASKPGAAIRVRVFVAAAKEDEGGCHDGHHKVLIKSAYSAPEAQLDDGGVGCSQSGGSLAPWAIVLLAVFALLPRPARLLVRSRRR
ncbi:MAG TPA: hypothetical protein VGK67_26140 [Myxococcales bacterium]|jgi:beta propeller repeat protein